MSVEADVWLVGEELLVGHTSWNLQDAHTLQRMYIDPLLDILGFMNADDGALGHFYQHPRGVFFTDPEQTLTLLIDFKSDGQEMWPYIEKALDPLSSRGLLSHWNGTHRVRRPITVVASGNAPFHLINHTATYRDIFLDAPLEALADAYDPSSAGSVILPTPLEQSPDCGQLAFK